jgi:hypothetical protein
MHGGWSAASALHCSARTKLAQQRGCRGGPVPVAGGASLPGCWQLPSVRARSATARPGGGAAAQAQSSSSSASGRWRWTGGRPHPVATAQAAAGPRPRRRALWRGRRVPARVRAPVKNNSVPRTAHVLVLMRRAPGPDRARRQLVDSSCAPKWPRMRYSPRKEGARR